MKILFDTNVVLDLLLDRKPFSAVAARLFSRVDVGQVAGFISATTVTTVHYLARRTVGDRRSREEIRRLTDLFEVASVNRSVLVGALESKFKDFEDAVLHQAALNVDAEGIVTRNAGDFKHAMIPVFAPEELDRLVQLKEETRNVEGRGIEDM